MKTGIQLLIAAALLFNVSCSDSSPKKNTPATTNPISEAPSTEPENLGPTGVSDPVDPDGVGAVDPVDYYPTPDPDDTPQLPGTPARKCGIVYKQANNPVIFFQENGQMFMLQEFSYDSTVFLRSIRFPNSSFNTCIDGYVDNNNFHVNTTESQTPATNPAKLYQNGEYSQEVCGHIAYVRNFSGVTSLNVKVGNVYYEIKPQMNVVVPPGVPTVSSSITESNSVEACVYSNTASFYNYNISFKPQFNALAFDLGALNL